MSACTFLTERPSQTAIDFPHDAFLGFAPQSTRRPDAGKYSSDSLIVRTRTIFPVNPSPFADIAVKSAYVRPRPRAPGDRRRHGLSRIPRHGRTSRSRLPVGHVLGLATATPRGRVLFRRGGIPHRATVRRARHRDPAATLVRSLGIAHRPRDPCTRYRCARLCGRRRALRRPCSSASPLDNGRGARLKCGPAPIAVRPALRPWRIPRAPPTSPLGPVDPAGRLPDSTTY